MISVREWMSECHRALVLYTDIIDIYHVKFSRQILIVLFNADVAVFLSLNR